MGQKPDLTNEEKAAIKAYAGTNKSVREMASRIGISKSAVQSLMHAFRNGKHTKRRGPRSTVTKTQHGAIIIATSTSLHTARQLHGI